MRRTRSLLSLGWGCGLAAFVVGIGVAQPAHALVPLENVSSVAAGGHHNCVITTGGGVKCWGLNSDAHLGNAAVTTGSRATPLDVSGLSSGVAALAAGEFHTCALTNAGGVKCWGTNGNGQLGDGTTTDRSAPVDVTGLTSGVTAIAAGYFHTCAVTSAGAVRCWGFNNNGQLGDGTTIDRPTPVIVPGLTGIASLAAGGNHTCALVGTGVNAGVRCWGLNTSGQVGDGTLTQRPTPVDVSTLAAGAGANVTSIAAGRFHNCAVIGPGGALKCWGSSQSGQVGDGSVLTNRTSPVNVTGLGSGVAKVTGGRIFTCALTTGGAVKCWGSASYGQVGDDYLNRNSPTDVVGLSTGVTDISTGNYHACAVTTAGRVRCWGANDSGQLGDGVIQQRMVPVNVAGLTSGMTKISARGGRSCAIGPSGGLQCWGDNYNGGLGDGGAVNSYFPTDVLSFSNTAVSVGGEHGCSIISGGAMCWGLNSSGQVGDGTTTTRFSDVPVTGLTSGVAAISSGYFHTCALTTAPLTSGGVKCWGRNAEGQLGNGTTAGSSTPVDVPGLTGVLAISAGGYHTCALTASSGVKCWGYNLSGQLGNSSTANTSSPVDVTGFGSGVASISAGGFHTCAVTSGGAAKCWGFNGYGGLGDNTFTNRSSPTDVFGLSGGIALLAAGEQHTCALTTSGGVKCWGYNNSALLGDYSSISRRTPVDVIDLPSGVTAIAAATNHNCALMATGGIKCWGFSGEGQVGDGIRANRTTPLDVLAVDATIVPAFSSSLTHTLALDADGKVYAWGSDSHGQLGQARAINRSTPAQVTGLPAVSHISLSQHALAVDVHGQVWAWGENSCGQLGPRGDAVTSKPSRVLGATGFTKVASGGCFSLALKGDGTVWGWGTTLPYANSSGAPIVSLGISNAVEIAAGESHALIRLGDGTVLALGDNTFGQLGQGPPSAGFQAHVQVPGIAGATAIAAGDYSSMVLIAGGQVRFWGMRFDGPVSSPTTLPAAASAPVSISIGKGIPHAALSGGSVVSLPPPFSAWQAVSGFAGVTAIEAGAEFQLGIGGGGQLYAGGSNTAGQLGQGSVGEFTGAPVVTGMTNVSMVAAGAINPSVLALKGDGTVWFWGADTLGESGDGAAVGSSVPRLVNISAKVLQVAAGDRFSLAFDVNGNVWGWGDNAGAVLDGTRVNRSTPAIVNGANHVQQIAAGGPALATFLRTDGLVMRSGSIAGAATNNGPVAVPGLGSIIGIAAGTSAYALRADNVLYAFGANASGELGNGATATSGTPVQVQGITGTIATLSAGASRAAALTTDGKVWSWGAGPLGNGTSGASSTAVAASGITDATAVSVGKLATFVRRQGGALAAWGDTALADSAGINALAPHAVAFHEPVKRVHAGANNAMGYILGNSGLAWGFGRYLTISNTSAAVGDGTYVARPRPVVLLAAGGAGNIDTNNWFFDMEPASAESVPVASTPKMLGVAQISGSEGGLAFDATIKYKSADFNKSVNNYVFGLVPPVFFSQVKSVNLSSKGTLSARAAKNDGFVLAQLTPSGWTDVKGQLVAYSQGTANAAGGAANILNGVPAVQIAGARFCIGYGESAGSMLSFNALREVLLLPGASQNTSGVPCVLTGVYVDGPVGSRVTTAVTFKASVVGLSPTGSVQFKDGAQALSGSLTISSENDAVASAQVGTSALAVGEHSIGATYFGDGQNAAVSAEIPLRHVVTAAATEARLVGPTSSDQYSQVVFEAIVIGLNPSGTVQFKDGASDIGGPVPLVGGQATLRIDTLGLGGHAITAVYSGDGSNASTTSNAVAHNVVQVFRTRVALTSSASDPLVGDSITLTATVTGNNPTGSVTFRDGTTVIGAVTLVNGVATLTLSSLGSGAHSITASYSGDGDDDAVSSPTFTQHVAVPALFSMNVATLAFGGQLRNTTSGVRTVTITNAGGAPLTVNSVTATAYFTQTHNCATVPGSASCVISVRFAPTVEGALNGSVSIQTSLGPHVVTLSGTGAPSLVSHYYTSILRRPADAGGLAFWDAEAVRVSALGANVNEVWFALAQAFYFSGEYTALNRDNTGYITDLYTTFFQRAPDAGGLAFWVGNLDQGMPREVALAQFMFSAEFVSFAQARYGNTAARAEVDAVMDFYRGLLGRLPDDGGFNYWVAQFRAAQCQGAAAIIAQVEAISSAFALSGEYAARGRTSAQYVGDLYNAFLRRGGDLGGVQHWIGQVATAAQTREQVRVQFRNSAEFQARVAAIIAQGCLP